MGIDKSKGNAQVDVSFDFYRPIDVVNLWGGRTKARTKHGWNPSKTTFEELLKIMAENTMAKITNEKKPNRCPVCILPSILRKGVAKKYKTFNS